MISVNVKGQKEVLDKMKLVKNPLLFFDRAIAQGAAQSVRRLASKTNKKTGLTSRGWTNIQRLGLSRYETKNPITTTDGKHSLVKILDTGRKAVFPKKPGGRLFIPLSQRAMAKKSGADIPSDWVFGVDYVLAKSAKAFSGTKFLTKELQKAPAELARLMIAAIRRVHGDT